MADTEEEIDELCCDIIEEERCSFGTLRIRVSQHYNNVNLSPDDISSIRQIFIAAVLRKWHDECEVSIEARVSELKNDKDGLLKLINDFTSQIDFSNAPDLVKTEFYDIIEGDRNLFSEEVLMTAFNKLINLVKLKVKDIQDDFRNENEFLEVLIDVIKKSDRNYENFINALQLFDFVGEKLKLCDVLKNIAQNNFKIDDYKKLQRLSSSLLQSSDFTLEETIRNEIRSYVVMERTIIEEERRKILLLMRKIIFFQDIEILSQDVKDIRVVCDIFHFCGQMDVFKFPVDNLIIIANFIKVHEKITICLSGRDAKQITDSESTSSLRGKDGMDGNAGESGGNIAIACEKIENGDLLSLVSNGGKGSNGQYGKDGVDGKNGQDVKKFNMTFRGEPFDIKRSSALITELENHIREVARTGKRSGPIVPVAKDAYVPKTAHQQVLYTMDGNIPQKLEYFEEPGSFKDDGLVRSFFTYHTYGHLLTYGNPGTSGTDGGLGGLGGEGGYAGIIDLEIAEDGGRPVKVEQYNGLTGIDGLGGYNGINGIDGRDAWAFHRNTWNEPKYFGLGCNDRNKYEIIEVDKSDEFAMWHPWNNMYKSVGLKKTINQSTSVKQRNKSAAIRSRASHAKTARKKATFHSNVKKQYSEYLNESFLKTDFLKEEIDLTLDMTKTTTKSKVKTKVKQTFNDDRLRKNQKLQEEILTFEEVKNKILKPEIKFEDFAKILRKSDVKINEWIELKEIYSQFIETLEQSGSDDFMEVSESSDQFCIHALKIENLNEYKLDPKEVLKIINERIILNQICEDFFTQPWDDSTTVFLPKSLACLIPYLINTNHFDENIRCENPALTSLGVKFATLNHYFNSDLDRNRMQVKELFSILRKTYLDSSTYFNKFTNLFRPTLTDKKDLEELFKAIFSILNQFKGEIKEIETIINQISQNSDSLNNFLANEEITKFIERNLIEEGIRSPIYRKILSFLFDINFQVFICEIDGSLRVLEENISNGSRTMNLLMEKGKFSELIFDEQRFKRIELKVQEVNRFSKEIRSFENSKHVIDKLNEELRKIQSVKKYENSNEKFQLEIQELNHKLQKAHSIREKVDFLKFPDFNVENTSKLIETILNFFDETYQKNQLRSALFELPSNILLSIYIHLFYERSQIKVQEFSSIIFTVLENRNLMEFFTTKFLIIPQSKWIIEVILIQIENYLNKRINFNIFRDYLNSVSYHPILFLFLSQLEQLKVKEMSHNDIEKVLKNMRHFSQATFNHLLNIQELNSWQHVITSEYWLEKFSFLSDAESPVVNELQSKFDAESLERLLAIMAKKGETLKGLSIVDFLKNFNSGEWIFSNEQFDILEDNDPENWVKEINKIYTSEGQRSVEQIVNLVKENKDNSESICMNIEKVADATNDVLMEEISNCSNYRLRNTQILSILTFYQSKKGALLQVGTGEGKTFVGATFALLKVIEGEKIHIVTSSSVLAERDASDPEIKRIFRNFGVSIGHNCHDDIDDRRRTYMECGVVYGTLGNFQRDHLLTVFYDKNILPAEYLQNVLVDEVDSILLDKGNNILYLSKELPNVDELESAFMFIWQWVNQETDDEQYLNFILKPENIRQAFLDNFYGIVFESDIRIMTGDDPKDIMEYLKAEEIFNDEGTILVEEFNLESLNISEDLKSKISYYIKKKIESPKVVKIPKFYHSFVMRYLDRWIKSALNAVLMEEGVQYVIDKVSGGSTVQSDPNIVILDVDTGTDQKNSEWDEALCQFLQLKHGCRLSELSLKSVFISNVSYFKLYKMKYGMTGTLGSKDERDKLNKFYDLEYATVPSYLPKKFTEYDAILTKSNNEWLSQIVSETTTTISEGRSVLIICNTIKDIDAVENSFLNAETDFFNDKNVKTYKRDYEEFNLGFLLPKKVIIATNLAGRGTDIRLSEELAKNGGLHVILTYLAPNVRVENQAYGRAARAGAKGSARMIILQKTSQVVKDLKHERDQQELIRLEEVSNFYQKFITVEEKFFKEFLNVYKKFSIDLEQVSKELKEILLENVKVFWSLWLDENTESLNDYDTREADVEESFKNFIENSTKIDPLDVELHPILRVEIFKQFFKSKDFESASKILSEKCGDSLGFEYNKILMLLNDNPKLEEEKIKQIRQTIMKFSELENNRNDRVSIVKIIKEKYRCTLKPLKGFENQLKEVSEVNQMFVNNLSQILGTGITPESFNCSPFSNYLYKEGFYNFLMEKEIIGKPKVDEFIDEFSVKKIAEKYQVEHEILFDFLIQKSSQFIEINDFANELKEVLNFPSREDFWDSLATQNVLINQIKSALIDLETLQDFSPFLKEECHKKFDKLQIELNAFSNCEIFMTNICEDIKKVNTSKVLAIAYNHEIKSDELFQELVRNNLVEFNKKAIFNFSRFDELKSSLKFDKFDSIDESNFNFIEHAEVRYQVIKRLKEQNILNAELSLNYENLSHLNLEENFIYESQVEEVLRSNFKYRIALENLLEKMRENSQNISINLYTNPHFMMINDLIENFIIQPSKVDSEKLEELEGEEIFSEFLTKDSLTKFLQKGFNANLALPKNLNFEALVRDLIEKKVILELKEENLIEYQEHTKESIECIKDRLCDVSFIPLLVFKLDNEMSSRFKHVEETVKLMLRRRDEIAANKSVIMKILQNAIPKFEQTQSINPVPVLIPIESFSNTLNSNAIECMKLKGLDCVIGVEEKKFTWQFWFNIITVMLTIIIQTTLAIKLFMTKKYAESAFVFFEAMHDIIYIISALKLGAFGWKSYARQKVTNMAWKNLYVSSVTALFKSFKRKQKQDNSYKLKPKDAVDQENVISSNKVVKLNKEKIIKSAISANTTANMSKKLDYIVASAIETLTNNIKIVWIGRFHDKFFNHELSEKFINELLEHQSEITSEDMLMASCKKINQEKDYFKMFIKTLIEKIGLNLELKFVKISEIDQISQISFDDVLNGTSLTILNQSIAVFLNDLNNNLIKEVGNSKTLNSNLDFEQQKKNDIFKKKILTDISKTMWEKLEDDLKCFIKEPALKLAATKADTLIAREFSDLIRQNHTKKNYSRDAITKNFDDKIEVSKADENFQDIVAKKASKIRKTARNLETIASLSTLKIPMEIIELEAAARIRKIKLLIQCSDIVHEFGEDGSEVVRIDVKDGHFLIDNHGRPIVTYLNLYSTLKNKINMEEFTIIKFKNEITKFLTHNQKIREIYENQRNNFYKRVGFYGIKECYNLLTKRGSEKFTNSKILIEIKRGRFLLKANQDLRSFNKNDDVKSVDTYKAFNIFRAEAVHKTLQMINEIIKSFSVRILTLADFAVEKAVLIKEHRGNMIYMPVEVFVRKADFTVSMSFHMQRAEDEEPEIFFLMANMQFKDYKNVQNNTFRTLMPIMSKRVDNERIPVANSTEVILREDLIGGWSIIDHTKIFHKNFSHVKLMTHCDEDENLPDGRNYEYILKYPLEFYHINDDDFYTNDKREKSVKKNYRKNKKDFEI